MWNNGRSVYQRSKGPGNSSGDYIELHLKGDGTVEFFPNAKLTRREWTNVLDHGDWIDRDELMKKYRSWFYEGDEVCESVKAATVVIPADKEKKYECR